ncbi:hypothetical protein D3C87_1549280 [compost metagenome]
MRRGPGIGIDPHRRGPHACRGAAQRCIDGAKVRGGMRVVMGLATMFAKVTGQCTRRAIPTGGYPSTALPKPGPIHILAGHPDTTSQRTFERHINAGRTGHANCLPGIVHSADGGLPQIHGDQLRSMLFIPGREQRPVKYWRAGTPGFAPVQIHAVTLTIHDVDPGEMRFGGPSAPDAGRHGVVGFKLGHDGHRIGMAFE